MNDIDRGPIELVKAEHCAGKMAGQIWGHVDGGSVYVLAQASEEIDGDRRHVQVQRRPFGDSLAEPILGDLAEFC